MSISSLQAFGAQGIVNPSSLCHLNCILVALYHCRLFRALVFRVVFTSASWVPSYPYTSALRGAFEVLGALQMTFVALEGGREGTFNSAFGAEWLLSALAITGGFQDANETLECLMAGLAVGFAASDAAVLDALGFNNLAVSFSAMFSWRFEDTIRDIAANTLIRTAASTHVVLKLSDTDVAANISGRINATLTRHVGAPFSPEAVPGQTASQCRSECSFIGVPPPIAVVYFAQRIEATLSGPPKISSARVLAHSSIFIGGKRFIRLAAICALPDHYTAIAAIQASSTNTARAINSDSTGELYFNDYEVNGMLRDDVDSWISKKGIMYFYLREDTVVDWQTELRAAAAARPLAAPLLMNVLQLAAGGATRASTHWLPVTDVSIDAASSLDAAMHATMMHSLAPPASGFPREDCYLFSGSAVPRSAIDLFGTCWR